MSLNATDEPTLNCELNNGVSDSDKLFRFVVDGMLLNAIGACGLLGHAIYITMLLRAHLRSSINCLLMGLATSDTLLILTSVLLYGLTAIYPYTGHLRFYYYYMYPHITPYVHPIANVSLTVSIYLTLIITAERWFAVCCPLHAKALCRSLYARLCVLGTAVFAIIYTAFLSSSVKVLKSRDPVNNEVIYCATITRSFHWISLILMHIIPFTLLAVLNACIVRQMRRMKAKRAQLSRWQRQEFAHGISLLVVVLVFYLCNLPSFIINVCGVYYAEQFDCNNSFLKMSDFLVTFNSSANFVVYVMFNNTLKDMFLKMFCMWWYGGARNGRSDGAQPLRILL